MCAFLEGLWHWDIQVLASWKEAAIFSLIIGFVLKLIGWSNWIVNMFRYNNTFSIHFFFSVACLFFKDLDYNFLFYWCISNIFLPQGKHCWTYSFFFGDYAHMPLWLKNILDSKNIECILPFIWLHLHVRDCQTTFSS